MRKLQASDILNMDISKEDKLELLKLWLTSNAVEFELIPVSKPKRKWWQFWKL